VQLGINPVLVIAIRSAALDLLKHNAPATPIVTGPRTKAMMAAIGTQKRVAAPATSISSVDEQPLRIDGSAFIREARI